MEPNQKFPFLSSKTEKKRAELTLLVILVKDFPSYRKIPSHEAIQMLPFVSCMIFRVIRLGAPDLVLSLGTPGLFCPQEVKKTTVKNKEHMYLIIYLLSNHLC